MIVYDKFWETLKKKGVSQYDLIQKHGVSAGQLSRIRSGSWISTHTLDMLCNILDCDVEEVITHVKE